MFSLTTIQVLATLLLATTSVHAAPTPDEPGEIGIPTGELGNINGLYGKPFSSSTVLMGAGAETFRPHELTAANGFIAVDGKVGFLCEKEGQTNCPHKPKTGFRVYFNGTADLNTSVKLGQQLFVTRTGRLGYNKPGASVPRGVILGKFVLTYTPGQSKIAGGRHWSFAKDESNNDKETSGLWACKGGEQGPQNGIRAVYAGVDGFDKSKFAECLKINPVVTPLKDEGPSAYAYS